MILLIIWIWICCFNFTPSSLSLGSSFRREAADTTVLSLFLSNKRWLKMYWLVLTKAFHVFPSLSLPQSTRRRRIGKRASGKAWSAPSPWLSSSVSCSSQPIRCCGTAWSNHLHCEHGERTEQPWPHILYLQPKLDQPQPKHFSN